MLSTKSREGLFYKIFFNLPLHMKICDHASCSTIVMASFLIKNISCFDKCFYMHQFINEVMTSKNPFLKSDEVC